MEGDWRSDVICCTLRRRASPPECPLPTAHRLSVIRKSKLASAPFESRRPSSRRARRRRHPCCESESVVGSRPCGGDSPICSPPTPTESPPNAVHRGLKAHLVAPVLQATRPDRSVPGSLGESTALVSWFTEFGPDLSRFPTAGQFVILAEPVVRCNQITGGRIISALHSDPAPIASATGAISAGLRQCFLPAAPRPSASTSAGCCFAPG